MHTFLQLMLLLCTCIVISFFNLVPDFYLVESCNKHSLPTDVISHQS